MEWQLFWQIFGLMSYGALLTLAVINASKGNKK